MLRVMGGIMIGLGILLTISVIGAVIGIPMIFIGLLFILVGKKREPIIVHMVAPPAAAPAVAPPETPVS